MADLVLYLGVTVIGYFIGSKVRSHKNNLSWTGKIQTAALTILVVLMGMRMGANEEITANLSTIGLTALVITIATVALSIGAIFLTRKMFGIDRYGRLADASEKADCTLNSDILQISKSISNDNTDEIETGKFVGNGIDEGNKDNKDNSCDNGVKNHDKGDDEGEEKQGVSMMTVLILIAVIVGMIIGYFVIRRTFANNMEIFDMFAGLGIKIGLCCLLVFVGLDLGIEGTVVDNFKKVGVKILAFPVVVVIATLIGAVVSGMIMGFSLKESLAIGAGFGWYTLAPGVIMEAGYLTASAVSFLHNVMREMFSILLIPLVAAKVGYIETTGMPGAAAMDVCLPIVERATRSDIAVYSFVMGVVLSILVPILVPLIIG